MMVEVRKGDIREEEFKKASETLEREIAKGLIKKKRPIKVIDISKAKQPTELLQTLRTQYLLGKLAATHQEKLTQIEIPMRDMFSTCNLGYDGMLHNKKLVNEKMDAILKLKKPNLGAYKNLLTPLGNMIIGYKVLKHYCADNDLLETNKLEKARDYYNGIKQQVETIDTTLIDIPRLYPHTLNSLKRKYGVKPMPKKHQAPVLYNVDGIPMKYMDLFDIDELIAEFEATHRDKSAIWRGAQTKTFKEWLEKV